MFTASPMTESFPFGCEHLLRSLSRIKNCSQVKKLTPQMSVRLRSASHYVQRLRNSCCCCERAFRFCGFPPALPQKRTTPPRMTEDTLYFSQVRKNSGLHSAVLCSNAAVRQHTNHRQKDQSRDFLRACAQPENLGTLPQQAPR